MHDCCLAPLEFGNRQNWDFGFQARRPWRHVLRVTQNYWGREAVSPKVSTLIIPIGAATFGGPIRGQGLLHQSEPWHFYGGWRSGRQSELWHFHGGWRSGRQSELRHFSRGGSLDPQPANPVHPGTVGATPLLRQMVSPVEKALTRKGPRRST